MTADLPSDLLIPEGVPAEKLRALTEFLSGSVGAATEPRLPIVAPALLLGHDALVPYAARMLPSSGQGMVHESQSFQRTGGFSLEGPLSVQAHLEEKAAARVFDFAVANSEQRPVGHMQTRLREVTPEEMSRFKGSVFPAHMDKGDVTWRWSEAFDAEVVGRYLALAKDPNPIHVDDEAARGVGLAGAVVPGMMFAGVIDFVLAGVVPECVVSQMKVRFMAPVVVGEALRYGVLIRGRSGEGRAKNVRVFVLRRDRIIAAVADLDMSFENQAT